MARSKGCTIALIVVAALLLIIIIGIVVVWINKDKLIEAGINVMADSVTKELVRNLPDGYTPEMVEQIMTDLKVAIKNNEIPGEDIQKLANTFQADLADKEIDKEEGRRLLIMIQEALGQEPPDFDEAPVEEMPDSLEAVPEGT
jgi:hypothetical protein